jgi:hypothetical protein
MQLEVVSNILSDGTTIEETTSLPYGEFDLLSKGRPITKILARTFIKDNTWHDLNNGQTASVVFDARPIMLLLSQKECIGIRCYFARLGTTANDQETLVLVGVDKDGHDLGVGDLGNGKIGSICTDSDDIEKSIIFEVGGGNFKEDFVDI